MNQCTKCHRRLPHVQAMFDGNSYTELCPICALATRNRLQGIPLKTAFTGTLAHQMFVEAVEFLGAKAPRWAKKVVAKGKAAPGRPQYSKQFVETLDLSEMLDEPR